MESQPVADIAPTETTTTYQKVPGGVIVPHRANNLGRSPAFDAKNLLKYVPINIYDGDRVIMSLKPGQMENDTWNQLPINQANFQPEHLEKFASPPPNELKALSPSSTSQASQSPSPGTSTTPSLNSTNSSLSESKASQPIPSLSYLEHQLSSLHQRIDSLTKSIDALTSQVSTWISSQHKTDEAPAAHQPIKIRISCDLGVVSLEALEVTQCDRILVVVLDPEKPYLIPKSGPVEIMCREDRYTGTAYDVHVPLTLFGRQLLCIFFALE